MRQLTGKWSCQTCADFCSSPSPTFFCVGDSGNSRCYALFPYLPCSLRVSQHLLLRSFLPSFFLLTADPAVCCSRLAIVSMAWHGMIGVRIWSGPLPSFVGRAPAARPPHKCTQPHSSHSAISQSTTTSTARTNTTISITTSKDSR